MTLTSMASGYKHQVVWEDAGRRGLFRLGFLMLRSPVRAGWHGEPAHAPSARFVLEADVRHLGGGGDGDDFARALWRLYDGKMALKIRWKDLLPDLGLRRPPGREKDQGPCIAAYTIEGFS